MSLRKELYSVEAKDESQGHRRSLKLKGTHRWPFSVKLPKGVGIPFGGPDGLVTNFVLPASLHDGPSKVTVRYEIVVQAKKGMFNPGLK